jgi:hypothetical protein
MIQTGRLDEFVDSFLETTNHENDEKTSWEFYLHKVFEGSFEEFKAGIETNKKNQELSARTIETTVQNSMSILTKFNPKGGE